MAFKYHFIKLKKFKKQSKNTKSNREIFFFLGLDLLFRKKLKFKTTTIKLISFNRTR